MTMNGIGANELIELVEPVDVVTANTYTLNRPPEGETVA
jgi:hypothetical protein